MNPYLIIAALLAIMGAGAGGFWLGVDHDQAVKAREDKNIAQAVQAASLASAQAISQIRINNTTIQQEVQREIRTETVYLECRHSPDGLRLVNAALTGAQPPGGGQLPGPDPPGR